MTEDAVFGSTYATSYDLIYAEKDYPAECDLLERMFREHARRPVLGILDLGCGTGRHARLFADRGYDVVGVDRSEAMLRQARQHVSAGDVFARFVQGDIRDVQVGEFFDVVVAMFAVLGYQTRDEDLASALRTARGHLNAEGLLVFDVWYAPAVLAQGPEERWKFYRSEAGGVLRYSHGSVLPGTTICAVDIDVWSVAPGDPDCRHARERHEMRFFTRSDLDEALGEAGFELVDLVAFPDAGSPPDQTTWNVLVTARAT